MLDVSEEENKDCAQVPFLKYSYAFNLSQTSLYNNEQTKQILLPAEELIIPMKNIPPIKNNYRRCAYSLLEDVITIPIMSDFESSGEYYSSLFHEIIHSTGHPSRLNRISLHDTKVQFCEEELIAEIGSAYLCAMCGVSNSVIDNQVSYIDGWKSKLKNDPEVLIRASVQAKKAVEFLVSSNNEYFSTIINS